jgi:hypothetical protein
VHEDDEQDALRGGLVLEGAHGAGAAVDFVEAALDPSVIRTALRRSRAGQQKQVTRSSRSARSQAMALAALPAVGEAALARSGCGAVTPL